MNPVNAAELVPNIVSPLSAGAAHAASPKPVKPRLWTVFAVWLGALVVGQITVIAGFITVGVVTGVIMGAQGDDTATIQAYVQEMVQQPLLAMLLSLLPFQLGMAGVVLLAARCSKETLKDRLGLLPQTGRTIGGFRLAQMAAFTISTALASVVCLSLLVGPPADGAIDEIVTDGSWWAILLLGILLSVIPAILEEVVFRGYFQRRLLKRFSPALAISVSTALFALMHLDSLLHIIAVVPLGVVTGLLAYRSNSVKPGMLVHAIHNTAAVGFGALGTALTPYLGENGFGLLAIGLIAALALIGLPAVVSLLRSAKSRPADEALGFPPAGVALSRELKRPDFLTDSRFAT